MINRYLFRTACVLSILLSSPAAWCGLRVLAPEPTIHYMMRDGFFARELLEKRPVFSKTGGGYPSIMFGGTWELKFENGMRPPEFKDSLGGIVGCLNDSVLLALCPIYRDVEGIRLDSGAIIWGEYSRYHSETRIQQIRLPFNLYGAIGYFHSPATPWRSKMVGIKNELNLVAHASKFSKHRGVLIGARKSFGIHTLGIQVQPYSFEKITKPRRLGAFSLDGLRLHHNYSLSLGVGYSTKNEAGSLYGTFKKDTWSFSGQQCFNLQERKEKSSGGIFSSVKSSKKRISLQEGRLEVNYRFLVSNYQFPLEVTGGYGWKKDIAAFSKNELAFIGKLEVHKNVRIKIGAKFPIRKIQESSKKSSKRDPSIKSGKSSSRSQSRARSAKDRPNILEKFIFQIEVVF